MDRLAMLRQMIEQKPEEPFVRYGLAMELAKLGHEQEAVEAFEHLVSHHPDYVATYLMYGNLLVRLGRPEDARGVFDRGMAAARSAGNDHALEELGAARAGLD